jgi:hypothetical protein
MRTLPPSIYRPASVPPAEIGASGEFGEASLQHVGRGLGYLLPVVQLGLISDPRRFDAALGVSPRDEYMKALEAFTPMAIEEPETHLHPKVQTRLAHWFMTLAMSGRRLIVETHSDHLVRRLRGLIARARAEEYGLGQLNITRWGAPAREGPAGALRHVPTDKQGRLAKKTGWHC